MLLLILLLLMQVDCIILHPKVVEENIEIQKNKTYELNKHFRDTWVIKLPWEKYVLGFDDKVIQI
jgi:hypothetical protein